MRLRTHALGKPAGESCGVMVGNGHSPIIASQRLSSRRSRAALATVFTVRKTKPSLEGLIEARLRATDNWPQPPWVVAAMVQDLETEVQELVSRRVDADYVRKIYRRKVEPASLRS